MKRCARAMSRRIHSVGFDAMINRRLSPICERLDFLGPILSDYEKWLEVEVERKHCQTALEQGKNGCGSCSINITLKDEQSTLAISNFLSPSLPSQNTVSA